MIQQVTSLLVHLVYAVLSIVYIYIAARVATRAVIRSIRELEEENIDVQEAQAYVTGKNKAAPEAGGSRIVLAQPS